MSGLHKSFRDRADYGKATGYRLLPLRFLRLSGERYLVTGLGGDYIIVSRSQLVDLVHHRIDVNSNLYLDLKAKHLIAEDYSDVHVDLLAAKYRTRLSRLPDWTALHMFVTTLRCDHSCQYCQVSRVSNDRMAFDMTTQTADLAIGLMFKSPSPYLKIEFQGGESLLNFPIVRYIVEEAKRRNDGRKLEFVVTTNLANITAEILDFAESHKLIFSTSLDGPKELHNANRPRPGHDSYEKTIEGIRMVRNRLGDHAVSALMTSTASSLRQMRQIVDEYVSQGFQDIFLRYISPYGFAAKSAARIGYETAQFIEFFKQGLQYILELNRSGIPIRETYTQLILHRVLTSYPSGYIDLQSPSGIGISGVVYNYNGEVYSSDEGRMLAEMGDHTFRLGTVRDSYEKLFFKGNLLPLIHETMVEAVPGCCDCALQGYCGTDPVFHHRTQGDVVGHRPTSAFCERNMELIKHVILLLEDEPESAHILRGWL